jgi:cytidine deaminase
MRRGARTPLSAAAKKALVAVAARARRRAVAPHSEFHVGAALLSDDGRTFDGINVESPSYGLTVCAERTAVFKALSEGARVFRAVAVVTAAKSPTPPCGACRQVLWDQCGDIQVILETTAGKRLEKRLSTLLPHPFGLGPKA